MDNDNRYKVNMIANRLVDIIKQLPYKQANLLTYALDPQRTAIGADFPYNEQTLADNLRDTLASHLYHPDSNEQYTLNQVCDMINKGEI